eukprot:1153185-Pelagomonas_calceolata.AAC.3
MRACRRHIKDFALVREVGSGAASVVYYGVCRKSCLPCAIKVYHKHKLTRLNRHQVRVCAVSLKEAVLPLKKREGQGGGSDGHDAAKERQALL